MLLTGVLLLGGGSFLDLACAVGEQGGGGHDVGLCGGHCVGCVFWLKRRGWWGRCGCRFSESSTG